MELRQLRDFVALAEELHYARAAARLGIDQSPLSRRIKEFEEHLGVLLFARTSRGTQLTPRGEFLLPWARSILSAADRAQLLVRTLAPSQELVRVALCDDVPSKELFQALSQCKRLGIPLDDGFLGVEAGGSGGHRLPAVREQLRESAGGLGRQSFEHVA